MPARGGTVVSRPEHTSRTHENPTLTGGLKLTPPSRVASPATSPCPPSPPASSPVRPSGWPAWPMPATCGPRTLWPFRRPRRTLPPTPTPAAGGIGITRRCWIRPPRPIFSRRSSNADPPHRGPPRTHVRGGPPHLEHQPCRSCSPDRGTGNSTDSTAIRLSDIHPARWGTVVSRLEHTSRTHENPTLTGGLKLTPPPPRVASPATSLSPPCRPVLGGAALGLAGMANARTYPSTVRHRARASWPRRTPRRSRSCTSPPAGAHNGCRRGDLHTTAWLSCSTRCPLTIKPPTAWRCAGRSGMEMVISVPGDVERTSNCPPDASTLVRIDAIPI